MRAGAVIRSNTVYHIKPEVREQLVHSALFGIIIIKDSFMLEFSPTK